MKKIFTLAFFLPVILAAQPNVDAHIKVDQFGYRPGDKKIAVISNPVTGYNSNSPFTPGTNYQVRKWIGGSVVFSGSPVAWNSGNTHTQSGDNVWWFDFSPLSTPGAYYVYDVNKDVRSYPFEIGDCAYNETLKHAFRTFYYQRCGVAKAAPWTVAGWWTDNPCHIGTQQDKDCLLYNNTASSTSLDLSGGWHDAGDHNKYVNFAWAAVIDMLLAYEENPQVWTDDMNIPESGNGIPDLLDEVKFELDWLLKMQQGNGSVLSVIGGGGGSPPSSDNTYRRYGPATTAASFTASSLFALGAIQFKTVGNSAYASTLQSAAINAWNWAQANPNVIFNNSGVLAAGEQQTDAYGTLSRKVSAACFLYALTGNASYKTEFDNNYSQIHLIQWTFAYPFESAQQDMLLYYTKLPGATTSIANDIKNRYSQSVSGTAENLPSYNNNNDAYRAYLKDQDYVWGSNSVKGHKATMYLLMNKYNLDGANVQKYTDAALGYVNYMHGVNPTAFAYLSNMGAYGAENSINEFYHSWFTDGSAKWDRVGTSTYGPPPGFVPGGPNPGWGLDGCCPSGCGGSNSLCVNLSPPGGQPHQKSYRDWNTSWPQNSWAVTENGIYYQASYMRMLSYFAGISCTNTTINDRNPAEENIQLYPNPVNGDLLHIRAENPKDLFIQLQNVEGKLVEEWNFTNTDDAHLNLENTAPGVYILSINGVIKRKVIRL